MYLPFYYLYYMGCCDDCLTCDIAFNAVMPLSRASTRGRYSRIEGVTTNLSVFREAVSLARLVKAEIVSPLLRDSHQYGHG